MGGEVILSHCEMQVMCYEVLRYILCLLFNINVIWIDVYHNLNVVF